MILNVSGRTDICAFYADWFFNRLKAGFVDVRNPYNEHSISRIYFDNVDAFLFCTKNPLPMLKRLDEITKPMLFHVTITPYHQDLEPGVVHKKELWEALKILRDKIGTDNLYIRYDPVLVNERYTPDYHRRAFAALCKKVEDVAGHIVISFLDEYKNVRENRKKVQMERPDPQVQKELMMYFARTAKDHGLDIFACNERELAKSCGFSAQACFSQAKAFTLTGKALGQWKARDCGCVEMADIGDYNSCRHFCKYCYANYDEKKVVQNIGTHDPESSVLLGKITDKDTVKVRVK